ncbi:MAG: leucine-rich repeat protein, partial [Anaerovoracaceae bacterium]
GSNVKEWETALSRSGASNPVFIVNNKYGIYKSDGNVYECNENAEATATIVDPKALTQLFIASDVAKIKDSAFFGCNQLIDVDFSKVANLKTIGTSAFSGCTGLETIRDFPQSVTEINANAFANCKGLESFDLTNAKSLTSMGDAAFSGCESLKTMAIPDSVKTIGVLAFGTCKNLTSVTMPKNITKMENSTFFGCNKLETIEIPKNVTEIGHYAFYNCQSLSSVNFFNQNPPKFQENSPDVPQGASFGNTKDGINVFLPSGANEDNWRQKLIAAGMTNPIFFTVDRVPPTASIKVGDKAYNQVTDPITFDTLLKDKAEITITANDTDSGIKNIEYQEVSSEADYKAEGTWKSYTQKFDISNRGKNIIYVRATDSAGNQTIINTNGFIIYNDSQLQTEITEFDKKEGNQKDILVKVNLNGNTLKNITNGETVLKSGSDYIINDSSPAKNSVSSPESGLTLAIQKSYLAKLQSGIQTLTFNFNPYGVEGGLVLNTPLEITIKEAGHTHEFNAEFTIDKAATCTQKGKKSRHCKDFALCGGKTDITKIELAPHTGGVANCHAKAICSVCNNGYGEIDPNKHDGGTEVKKIKLPTHKEEGYSGDTYCKGCNAVLKLGKVFSKTPHTTLPGWHHDEKSHWHECQDCKEKFEIADHTWVTEASLLAKPDLAKNKYEIITEDLINIIPGEKSQLVKYICSVCGTKQTNEFQFSRKVEEMKTGMDLIYTIGTGDGATFTSDANINGFLGVGIDAKAMKSEDIKVKAGSTIVTISSEYMDTLSNGKHTVSIYSTTGTATATFTVKGEESLNPITGDNGNMPLWISLLFVSGGALLLFGISKKRRKVNEK